MIPPGSRVLGVFCADLHLDTSEASRDRLGSLLQVIEKEQAPLYILGDLFHYWYGRKHLRLPMYRPELELFRQATDGGAEISVIPGNRDYLLDRVFESETGVRVLGDDLVVTLGDERIHLSHGDLFATSDRGYLWLRRILRSRMLTFLAHHSPGRLVDFVGRRIRHRSDVAVPRKADQVLEPDRGEVQALFEDGCRTVVCGHFHRFRDETFPPREGGGRFIILEPFEDRGFYLVRSEQEWLRHWVDPGAA